MDADWDGTYVQVRAPDDVQVEPILVIELSGCAELRMGGPNDEAIQGHPLHGSGLSGYQAHVVQNSRWIEHVISVNSVHPHHSDEPFGRLSHFVLPFHDEMVEALARSIEVSSVMGTLQSVLATAVERVTADEPW